MYIRVGLRAPAVTAVMLMLIATIITSDWLQGADAVTEYAGQGKYRTCQATHSLKAGLERLVDHL